LDNIAKVSIDAPRAGDPSVRSIPSIEQLRQRDALRALEARYGRGTLVDALRAEAAIVRASIAAGARIEDASAAIEAGVARRLSSEGAPSLRRVINATGVVVHTNLGRAPLCRAAVDRVAALGAGYTNLEYDLDAGARGRRDVHAARLICRLTGAESALVVNNNAAATLIVLAALAAGREAIISRGELVEIGGGFRIPDVMAQSGVILREVGTTNRTRAADYAAAIGDRTALILRVHPSNFRMAGFTERPALAELVAIGRRFGVPVVEDLGSGYLGPQAPAARATLREPQGRPEQDRRASESEQEPSAADERARAKRPALGVGPQRDEKGWGPASREKCLRDEPIVSASLADGADVVMFSGDKLLGGPQAGIIAGATAALARVRAHPLMRALRVDKLTYAALEATLEEYVAGRAAETVPVVRMIALPLDEIDRRATALAGQLEARGVSADVIDGSSTIGGGSAPGSALPTRLVRLRHSELSAAALEARLRLLDPPVIARIENDHVVIDLRTVYPDDDAVLARSLIAN
jgi:L-seryl-tRNA(Ser) seleniumtransferase